MEIWKVAGFFARFLWRFSPPHLGRLLQNFEAIFLPSFLSQIQYLVYEKISTDIKIDLW